MVPVWSAVVALVVGVAGGFLFRKTIAASNAQSTEARAQKVLLEAEREADATRVQALQDAQGRDRRRSGARPEEDVRARREEIARQEQRIAESETDLQRARRHDRGAGAPSSTNETRSSSYVREQLEKATEPAPGAARADRAA